MTPNNLRTLSVDLSNNINILTGQKKGFALFFRKVIKKKEKILQVLDEN